MTPPQYMEALAKANHIRLARADLKRQIETGAVSLRDVLLDPPPEIDNMPIGLLLMARHRWGVARSRRFLSRLAIGERRTIGHLTERQRRIIVEAL